MNESLTNNEKERILKAAKKLYLVNLLGGCCEECGETKLHRLDFHHIDPNEKEYTINELNGGRLSKLLNEVDKCKLLCSNCHRLVHFRIDLENTHYRKLKDAMLEYKNINSCECCGYSGNNIVFSFHHVNPNEKEFLLSKARCSPINLLEKVKNELDKCIVLCENCHRDYHIDSKFFEDNWELIVEKSKNIKELKIVDNNLIIKMHTVDKKTMTEICKELDLGKSTVCTILRRNGFGKSMNDIKIDETKILNLHNSGLSALEISRELKCNKTTIFNALNRLKIKPNISKTYEAKKKFNPTKEELELLLKDNTLEVVSKIYNVSKVAIWARAKSFNINTKQNRKK